MENTQIRVAIVGSGMAGLVAAHLLKQDARARYEVAVFEEASLVAPALPFYDRDHNSNLTYYRVLCSLSTPPHFRFRNPVVLALSASTSPCAHSPAAFTAT